MGSYEITGEEMEDRDPDAVEKRRKKNKAVKYGAVAEAVTLVEVGREYLIQEGPIIDMAQAIESYDLQSMNTYVEESSVRIMEVFFNNPATLTELADYFLNS